MISIRKYLLFFFLQLILTGAYSQLSQQQLDSVVDNYTKNLRYKSIDTVCVYEEYCVGCLFYSPKGTSLCAEKISFLPTYIIWKKNGKTFMTKKDVCFDYSVVTIANDSFWNYYLAKKEQIIKEELKTPQYKDTVEGKEGIHSLNIDHSVFFRITMNMKNESVSKLINSFFFTKELGIKGENNINYDYNTTTALNGLHLMLQRLIKNEFRKKKLNHAAR